MGLLGSVPIETFLERYWQQEPLLVRQALPGFQPPIDGDDLAGLACDPLAEARLVSGNHATGQWQVRHGPFADEDFAALGERDWTLLVQDVEKHYPPAGAVLEQLSFLPRWRVDDLMVSFAAPGGSVGPHVDQYDVFLLQVAGHRRWNIARQFDPALRNDTDLKVLASFEPEKSWLLEPGDLLYLPPGVAHHGVAEDACLTYSLGCRAPSAADLLLALGEELADSAQEGERFGDAGRPPAQRAGEVDPSALDALAALLRRAAEPPDSSVFFTRFLSRFRSGHAPAPPPRPVSAEALRSAVRRGDQILVNPWSRVCWFERSGAASLFASGDEHSASLALAQALGRGRITTDEAADLAHEDWDTLRRLYAQGHVYISSDGG